MLNAHLRDGFIDFVSTDHAPHEKEAKGTDLATAAFGTTGLETSLRVLVYLFQNDVLTPERLVQVFSTSPAEFMNIEREFGAIKTGYPFHAVMIDPMADNTEVTTDDLESLNHNNCFVGSQLPDTLVTYFNPLFSFDIRSKNRLEA
jgi:dihydroorotase